MDPVTLSDVEAPDSVLSVAELNRIDRYTAKVIGGIPTDTSIIICALGVDSGLSGAQLTAIKDSIEAIAGVNAVRPAVRLVSRAEIDMPVGTITSLVVSAGFRYNAPAVPE